MKVEQFQAEVQRSIPDNTSGQITPAILRAVLLLLAQVIHEGGFEPEPQPVDGGE